MKGKLIFLGGLALTVGFLLDRAGGLAAVAAAVPWNSVIGLPLVFGSVGYMFYVAFIKQGTPAMRKRHSEKVAERVPKLGVLGALALTLVGAALYFGPSLVDQAKAEAAAAQANLTGTLDTAEGASAEWPPLGLLLLGALLVIVGPLVGFWFIRKGEDTESRVVRSAVVGVVLLGGTAATIAAGAYL